MASNLDPTPLPPAVPQTSGMAITSLVLGCVSFFCWILTGLPAVILGVISLNRIKRSEGRLTGDGLAIAGIATGAISTFLVLPLMIALLLPAIQAARESARRSQSMNNLRQISLGMLNHESVHRQFPAAGVATAEAGAAGGGSQLSWRVHILPFIEEQSLYEEFHLDEPWDSEHNRTLVDRMPAIFQDPNGRVPPGDTPYLAVTGPGTAFGDGTAGPTVNSIGDGFSNTIFLVEVDPEAAVPWTKPQDWQFDPADPTRHLGNLRHRGFLSAKGDGAVEFIHDSLDPLVINALMTANGGEPIGPR